MNETLHWADLQDTGNAQAQLVLYAIARHADWTTGECYPKQEDLAKMAKCTDRTVRTYLRTLEEQGFIEREVRTRKDGGKTSDLIRLKGFAQWVAALRGGGQVPAPKVVSAPPENLSGTTGNVSSTPPGKQLSAPPGKQVSGLIDEPSNKQSKELSAGPRASHGARALPARPVPEIKIVAGEAAFGEWVSHLRQIGQGRLSDDMRDAGVAYVSKRWPTGQDVPLRIPEPQRLTERSRAMTGDHAYE